MIVARMQVHLLNSTLELLLFVYTETWAVNPTTFLVMWSHTESIVVCSNHIACTEQVHTILYHLQFLLVCTVPVTKTQKDYYSNKCQEVNAKL